MKKKYSFSVKTILFIAILCSSAISIIMMNIALDHNPMGEFCEYSEKRTLETDCQINWVHLCNLGFIWFLFSFVSIFFTASAVKFILICMKKKEQGIHL